MKKIFAISLLFNLLLLNISETYAQDGFKSRRERVESLKVAFITQELDLSPEEAERFWPTYNEMNNLISNIKTEERRDRHTETDPNEKKAQDLILMALNREQQILDIKKDYLLKLSNEISAKKTVGLLKAEEQFKRELLRQVRKRN